MGGWSTNARSLFCSSVDMTYTAFLMPLLVAFVSNPTAFKWSSVFDLVFGGELVIVLSLTSLCPTAQSASTSSERPEAFVAHVTCSVAFKARCCSVQRPCKMDHACKLVNIFA